MIPAIFTFLGAIFSCTNYFRVIFTGGVGKNGSTIAVSLEKPLNSHSSDVISPEPWIDLVSDKFLEGTAVLRRQSDCCSVFTAVE